MGGMVRKASSTIWSKLSARGCTAGLPYLAPFLPLSGSPCPGPGVPALSSAPTPPGNSMTIEDCDGWVLDPKFPMTIEDGFNHTDTVCMPSDLAAGYTVGVGGGPWTSEISWRIVGPSGGTWLEDTGEDGDYFLDQCPTPAPTVCSGEDYTVVMSDSFGNAGPFFLLRRVLLGGLGSGRPRLKPAPCCLGCNRRRLERGRDSPPRLRRQRPQGNQRPLPYPPCHPCSHKQCAQALVSPAYRPFDSLLATAGNGGG